MIKNKKILFIILVIVMLSITGCGNKKAKGIAYTPVWKLFSVNDGTEFDSTGNGYNKHIDKIIKENNERSTGQLKKSELNNNILYKYDVVWMNNGKFVQFSDPLLDINDDDYDELIKIKYIGSYNISNNNVLSFDYDNLGWTEDYPINFLSMKYYNKKYENENEYDIEYEGEQSLLDNMIIGSEHSRMIDGKFFTYELGICDVDAMMGFASIAGAPISIYSNNETYLQDNDSHSNKIVQDIYLLGDYIVTGQQGFYFENINSKEDFSIRFKMPENATYYSYNISESPSGINVITRQSGDVIKWDGIINFSPDQTYTAEYEYQTINGNWQLFDNHILLLDTNDENNKDNIQAKAFLYLDFDNSKIYVPGYVKCDRLLEYIKEDDVLIMKNSE